MNVRERNPRYKKKYSETDKSFINEHINSDDPNKTASDSEITINSMEHHLPDSITSVKNLNVKRCDCITRLIYIIYIYIYM